jgi:hypothetical protein
MPAITPRNFWLWFGGTWLGVGAPFLAFGIWIAIDGARRSARLEREGRAAEGIVLVKEVREEDSGPSFRISFRFSPPGQGPITREAEVSEEAWDALEERGPIAVTYLPENPRRHRVSGEKKEFLLPLIFGILGGVLTCLGGMVLLKAIAARRAEARLAQEGIVADAKVTAVSTAKTRIHGVLQWRVRYRFEDSEGVVHEGATTISPEEVEGLEPGQTVRVRYDPARPGRTSWIGRAEA